MDIDVLTSLLGGTCRSLILLLHTLVVFLWRAVVVVVVVRQVVVDLVAALA
jgi:hypothetical protein